MPEQAAPHIAAAIVRYLPPTVAESLDADPRARAWAEATRALKKLREELVADELMHEPTLECIDQLLAFGRTEVLHRPVGPLTPHDQLLLVGVQLLRDHGLPLKASRRKAGACAVMSRVLDLGHAGSDSESTEKRARSVLRQYRRALAALKWDPRNRTDVHGPTELDATIARMDAMLGSRTVRLTADQRKAYYREQADELAGTRVALPFGLPKGDCGPRAPESLPAARRKRHVPNRGDTSRAVR